MDTRSRAPEAGVRTLPRNRLIVVAAAGAVALGLAAAQLAAFTTSADAAVTAPADVTADAAVGPELIGSDVVNAYTETYDGETYVYLDSAAFLAAREVGYQFEVRRDGYGAKPTMTMFTVDGGEKSEGTEVPPELVKGLKGLTAGLKVKVTDADGTVLFNDTRPLCPAGYEPQRIAPTGPAEPTYPTFCGGNWFTRSLVFGIDQGWASNMESYLELDAAQVKAGDTLTMTTSIGTRAADLLGMPEDRRTLTQRVEVGEYEGAQESVTVEGTPQEGFSAMGVDKGQLMQDASPGMSATGGVEDVPVVERPANRYLVKDVKQAAASEASRKPGTKGAAPRTADPDKDTLPDLVAEPAWAIEAHEQDGVDRLVFNAHEWNAGPAPLVVEGFRRSGSDVMDAYQFFYEDGKQIGNARTGTMEFHDAPNHNHWHFLDFAKYELVTPEGDLVTTSGKQSWCLAPTDPVDMLAPNANWRPEVTGLTSSCGQNEAVWLRESLPVGWGDTYVQYQTEAFDLSDVPNGTYRIRITVNPDGNLHEVSPDNNVSHRTVIVGGEPGARTVEVPKLSGVNTEAGTARTFESGPSTATAEEHVHTH